MPALSGDGGRTTDGDPTTWTSLTQLQYERFLKWASDPRTKLQPDSAARYAPGTPPPLRRCEPLTRSA